MTSVTKEVIEKSEKKESVFYGLLGFYLNKKRYR